MALDYKSSLSRYRRYLQVVREQPLVRAGIWTVLSLILVIVMIVIALKPTLVVIAGLLGQISQNKETIVKLNDKILKLQQASKQLDEVTPRLPILDEALPATSRWDQWAEEVSDLASQSGVQVVSAEIGPVPLTASGSAKPVKEMPQIPGISFMGFSISAIGTYDQLKTFAASIENTRRLDILSAVDFATVKNPDGTTNLTVYINGAAAYAPMNNN